MNKILKRDQLVEIRGSLFDLIKQSLESRNALEDQKIITRVESERIGKYEDTIRNIADDLNSVILRQVIADIDEPGTKIVAVTKDVKEAIETLKSLNDFLGVLAAVISMAGTVLMAFSTNNPLVLVNILQQIEALL
jgi:ArsR family metal-binding transcriptional regulator